MTVRQKFYALVSRGLIAKTEAAYLDLAEVIANLESHGAEVETQEEA